jgi:hypothetical protein
VGKELFSEIPLYSIIENECFGISVPSADELIPKPIEAFSLVQSPKAIIGEPFIYSIYSPILLIHFLAVGSGPSPSS